MSNLNDNILYLALDGVDVCTGIFRSVEFNPSNSPQETTSGCGVDHVQREPGLNDTTMRFSVTYRKDNVNAYIRKLRPGNVVLVEYGSEGRTSGKPRHEQYFIVSGSPHGREVSKTLVEFNVDMVAQDEPIIDMMDGGVYP